MKDPTESVYSVASVLNLVRRTVHYKLVQGKEDMILLWRTHIEKRVADLERQSHDLKATAARDEMLAGAKPQDALALLLPLEERSTLLFAEANELFHAETVFAACSDAKRSVPQLGVFLPPSVCLSLTSFRRGFVV